MYKMIIVDDEPLICKGLASLIEWEEYGIEIIGEAGDGLKAYLLIKAAKPDLALIDIAMPGANGIELLDMCAGLDAPPKFIILSGYSDFEYVRQSMQMGAINYLLKPVNPDELKNTAIAAAGLLDDIAAHKQQFDESLEALRNDTLNRLLTNRIESRELREKCRMVNISFHCSHMRVAMIRPLFDNNDISLRWVIFSSMQICQSVFQRVSSCYTLSDIQDNIAIILKDNDGLLSEEEYLKLCDKCTGLIASRLEVPAVSALGPEASSSRELPQSYQHCIRAVKKKMAVKAHLGDTPDAYLQDGLFPSIDINRLTEYIQLGTLDELKNLVHQHFTVTLSGDMAINLDLLKYQLIELIIYATQTAGTSLLPESGISKFKQDAYLTISKIDSSAELEQEITSLLACVMSSMYGAVSAHYSPMVQNAVSYIRAGYQDYNLSLKTMAAAMEMNAAYLGRQFSQETGEFFSDYLNKVRISQAVRLLNTTSLKALKIAELVGFTNTSYFFTVFKKVTGKRPGDYRLPTGTGGD